MIFVTVGNATQGFARLLNALDDIGKEGVFDGETVIVQTGNNPELQAKSFQSKPFLTMEDFESFVAEADLIICHAGAGTLMHVLRQRKVPIVMPRREKYGEIINDHQIQLVEAFAAEKKIIPVYEPEDLKQIIFFARENIKTASCQVESSISPMTELVAQSIKELTRQP